MPLEKILEKITAQAQEEAQAIIAQAKAQAQAMKAAAQGEAAAQTQLILEEGRVTAQRLHKRLVQQAELDARKSLLAEKQTS